MNKLFLTILVLAFVATALAGDKDDSGVKKWRKKFAKEWKTKNSASIERRSANVKKRRERIAAHNADPEATYQMGSNEYDDLDSEEFVQKLCGTKAESKEYVPKPTFRNRPAGPKFNSYTTANLPVSLDWSGYCFPAVSQGRCGSCWAFSTLSMLGWFLNSNS
jgi:Ni/Co efflux regulator RcnB